MSEEIHMKTKTGIVMSNPMKHFIYYHQSEPEETWAHKRYNILIQKILTRKSIVNGIMGIIIALIVLGLVNYILYLLFVYTKNPLQLVASAYLDIQLMRLASLACESAFEGNNVQVKRRGRILEYKY